MSSDVFVHPRIHERHPELTEKDVLDAWEGCIRSAVRFDVDEVVAIGSDSHGRLIEMFARCAADGCCVIYHAFTPPTRKMLVELGLSKRR